MEDANQNELIAELRAEIDTLRTVISNDIIERKQMEKSLKTAKHKAEAANRAKSRFLAAISHELRTPLTSILGFASLIDQANLEGERKKEYINHIVNSGSYLLSLINSLLDYNKLETNNFESINLPLNLKELMQNVIAMLTGAAELKKLNLVLNYENDAPLHIKGNSRILRQILINLVGNAIKFTDKGYVSIDVNYIRSTNDSVTLKIGVTDTGAGIPPQEQKSIFRQFYQLGNVYTRNTSLTGTGLGLAIVKKLVKLMHSSIKVKSAPNQGSTFYFTATFPKISFEEAPWLPYATTVRILVIQDNHARNYIHTLLSNTTYDVTSSKETINVLFSAQRSIQPYDIVVMDNDLSNIQQEELVHLIQDHCDLHQPLMMLLHTNPPSSTQKHIYTKINLQPNANDVRCFQTELKSAWEASRDNAKKNTIQITQSTNPYVLLVEDNVLIQIIHKHLLEELGYQVDVAGTAAETLAMLPNHYDLLLIDIGLPDISGFELMKTIRLRERERDIPIIVLTGYSDEEERQHCLRAGANDVATKPISKSILSTMLSRYTRPKVMEEA